MCLFQLWFPQDICPVVGLLGHMVVLFLVFQRISVLFSIVVESVCIPTYSVTVIIDIQFLSKLSLHHLPLRTSSMCGPGSPESASQPHISTRQPLPLPSHCISCTAATVGQLHPLQIPRRGVLPPASQDMTVFADRS